jgi:hypothetical protein
MASAGERFCASSALVRRKRFDFGASDVGFVPTSLRFFSFASESLSELLLSELLLSELLLSEPLLSELLVSELLLSLSSSRSAASSAAAGTAAMCVAAAGAERLRRASSRDSPSFISFFVRRKRAPEALARTPLAFPITASCALSRDACAR